MGSGWGTSRIRGATTAEKLRGGPRFGSQTGALAPRARPKARAGCWVREGSPPPAVRWSGGITPGRFVKTLMLNHAFW